MPNRRHILIIEDDEVAAEGLRRFLVGEGFRCTIAGTFAKGVALTQEIDFDAKVADLGMPDAEIKNEMECARRLPELGGEVVAYTGSGDFDLIAAVRAAGAEYVQKPGLEMLVDAIWAQINYRRSDRDSQVGQQRAQQRIQQKIETATAAELKESTPVSLSLNRVFVLVCLIVTCTATITTAVLTKVGSVETKVNKVDDNLTLIRAALEANTSASNKRMDSFESALKGMDSATQARILEWSKWRWNVSRDIRQLGEATKTPVSTTTD